MPQLRAFWIRLRRFFNSRHGESDFDAELESHIAMHIDDGIRSGLTPEEARRQALIRLGGAEQTRQAVRERRTLPWLESPIRDVAYALRMLAKHRGATAAAILSIGLGIGANATIFSMVSRLLLRPAPVGDPSTLLAVYPGSGVGGFSWPLYNDLRDQAKSFSSFAGYAPLVPASIVGNGEPQRVWGQAVTTNFFDVAQLGMVHGRGFNSGEDRDPVVVVSAGLWRRQFRGDPELVGKSVTISGRAFTVVGIAPAAFHSVDQLFYGQFWVPLGSANQMAPTFAERNDRNAGGVWVVGRLRSGETRAHAAAELNALAKRAALSYPDTDKDDAFVLEEAGILPPSSRAPLLIFLTALAVVALLVLAIAGANVANLLFAQAASRQRDMAVRLALGATRARLQRQMLTESLLLGLGGGALGVILSVWATRALSALHLPVAIPIDIGFRVDWRVQLFTFLLSVASGLLLGVAPAWAAARPLLTNALKGEDALARPGSRWTMRNTLVVTQIAMSVVLLSMTGLFLRSLQSAAGIDIGFRTQGLLMMSVDPRLHGYKAEQTVDFLSQLQERVAALPGVVSAAWTDYAPLSTLSDGDSFHTVGRQDSGKVDLSARIFMVTPGYFETMGIPRIAGRDFGGEAATGPRTAIVNKAFAERFFGGANPIGQQVADSTDAYQIVGVVANVKSLSLGEDLQPVLYRSLKQSATAMTSFVGYTLVVHASGNPAAMMAPIRGQIHALDPTMAIYNEETMEEHVRAAYFLPRLAATLFGAFGFIGLVLAAVGLFGVMSYAVSRRTREIGIRMALGAKPGVVERLVLRQGLVLTIIAVVLGWPVAWMLSKLAATFLYGIHPHDAITFAIVPPFLMTVALVACWIPARRAASIDPMKALRTE
jgi:predicted permease